MRYAVGHGDVFTSTPLTSVTSDPNAVNRNFFATVASYDQNKGAAIAAETAQQLALGKDAAAFVSLDTPQKIATALNASKTSGQNLVRRAGTDLTIDNSTNLTGPAELGRYVDAKGFTIPGGVANSSAIGTARNQFASAAAEAGSEAGYASLDLLGSVAVVGGAIPGALGTYAQARASGDAVLGADAKFAEDALVSIGVGAAIIALAPVEITAGVTVGTAALAVGAAVAIKAAAESAWRYVSEPLARFGNLLSAGDLADATGAAGDVGRALVKWAASSVSDFVKTLSFNASAFASDNEAYISNLAQQIWNGTKNAFTGAVQKETGFRGGSTDAQAVTDVVSQQLPGRAGSESHLASTYFGTNASDVQRSVSDAYSALSQQLPRQAVTAAEAVAAASATEARLTALSTALKQDSQAGSLSKITVDVVGMNEVSDFHVSAAQLSSFYNGSTISYSIGGTPLQAKIVKDTGVTNTLDNFQGMVSIYDQSGNLVQSFHQQFVPEADAPTGFYSYGASTNSGASLNVGATTTGVGVSLDGFGANAVSLSSYAASGDNLVLSGEASSSLNFGLTANPNGSYLLNTSPVTAGAPGSFSLSGDLSDLSSFTVGSGLSLGLLGGNSFLLNGTSGAGQISAGGTPLSLGNGSTVDLNSSFFDVTPSGSLLGKSYTNVSGNLVAGSPSFQGVSIGSTYGTSVTGSNNLLTSVNAAVPTAAQPTNPTDTTISNISVTNLSGIPIGQNNFTSDPTGQVLNVINTGDTLVSFPTVNTNGLFNNSPSGILSGNWRPGNQKLGDPSSTLTLLAGGFYGQSQNYSNLLFGAPLADYNAGSVTFTNIDPLVLDLDGNGVGLSNWINNSVYFDTNVGTNGLADGKQHHTSWVSAGDGILALDVNGNGKIDDITETVSEFFRGGSYANGFKALASMATAGATSFTASTSLTDSRNGKSFFSELTVWQDANQDGVTQSVELKTLAQLGITSISLVPSANVGESIEGSAVTGRATFTGAAGNGQVASIELQTDTSGDIATTSNGGVVINSTPEGGASAANSFVAKNTAAHSYTLQNGQLTDTTTSLVVGTGMKGVFSTTQGDTITVAASDTNSYWLGGGSGADTLNGGAGNTVFLINSKTVVHAGSGFNIAQVEDSRPITVDLKATNLDEVIGGKGDGIFNASGVAWNVFIQGGDGNNIILGGGANSALAGGTGDDVIEAGTGGSVIRAGLGNDVIYGGSGSTTMVTPRYVNAGNTSNLSFVERLYLGVLRREADPGGLANWVNQLGTMNRTDVANAFVTGPEGVPIYGSMNDSQFVTALFQTLIGRAPSSGELSSFTQGMASGTTRGSVAEQLADSAQSVAYLGSQHSGASDIIYGGPGHDVVSLGTNNSVVNAGAGSMTVIGKAGSFSVIGLHGSYADYRLTKNADGSTTITDQVAGRDGAITYKDVSALDFSDISQVSTTNALGMPVNDQLAGNNPAQVTNKGTYYTINTSTVLANDLDYAGHTLSVREILDNNGVGHGIGSAATVNGGTATLVDASTIKFVPTANFTGIYSFRYHIADDAGQNGTQVQQIGTTATAEMTATVYINRSTQPTDPLLDSEWFLQSTNTLPVWKDWTGKGVSVGVFDPSGNVDFNNLDLVANAGGSVKVDSTPGIDHVGTHATLVAGVIGAALDGGGAVGVAPGATIGSESIGMGDAADITNILHWGNYDVVNNSWGQKALFTDNGLTNTAFGNAYKTAATTGRAGKGTIIVFAGGNSRQAGDNTNYHNESNSRYAINVGGINAPSDLGSLQLSGQPFSNPGASILVSAPANNVTSTGITFTNRYGQQFGADYQTTQGTSFATPIVSGVVALMLQANPDLGYRDVQQILAYSAKKVDPTGSNWAINGATNWNGGGLNTSEDYGFGEVNATAAVRLAESWTGLRNASDERSAAVVLGKTSTSTTATALNYAIPTDQGTTATPALSFTMPTTASQLLNVEHASVELNLVGVDASQLIVKLIAPSGVVSTLVNKAPAALNLAGTTNPQSTDFVFDSVRDFGESSTGTWKVEVAYAPGFTPVGSVAGAAVRLYGSPTTDPKLFVYTDDYATLGTGTRATLSDASGGRDILNVAAVTGAVSLNLTPSSTTSTIMGKALTIAANSHVQEVHLGDGAATVVGNNLGDVIAAGRGAATITGGAGNDVIYGGGCYGMTTSVTDTLNGGAGDDYFYIGTAKAKVDGGAGTNSVDFSFVSSSVTVNLKTNTVGGAATGSTFKNVTNLAGSAYNDVLVGSTAGAYLSGGAGDDTLVGWGGDTIDGGTGVNTLDYSSATDAVSVNMANQAQVGTNAADTIINIQKVIGSAQNDYFTDGGTAAAYDGGAGDDVLDFSSSTGVNVDLSNGTGTASGRTLSIKNVEYVYGASYRANTIKGGSNTVAMAGSLIGGDHLTATSATTFVDFSASGSADGINGINVNLATGVASGNAAQGDVLTNVHSLFGTSYNDILTGTSGTDYLSGVDGVDTLTGNGGTDTYYFGSFFKSGTVTIVNGSAAQTTAAGELDIGVGSNTEAPANLWFKRSGNDLVVQIMGTTAQTTVKNWYTQAAAQLSQFVVTNGQALANSKVAGLVTAMANYVAAHPGYDPAATANPAITDTNLLASVNSAWTAAPAARMAIQSAAASPAGQTAPTASMPVAVMSRAMELRAQASTFHKAAVATKGNGSFLQSPFRPLASADHQASGGEAIGQRLTSSSPVGFPGADLAPTNLNRVSQASDEPIFLKPNEALGKSAPSTETSATNAASVSQKEGGVPSSSTASGKTSPSIEHASDVTSPVGQTISSTPKRTATSDSPQAGSARGNTIGHHAAATDQAEQPVIEVRRPANTEDDNSPGANDMPVQHRHYAAGSTLASLIDRFSTDALAYKGETVEQARTTPPDLIKFLDQMAAFHSGKGLSTLDHFAASRSTTQQIAQLAAAH